MLQNFGTWKKNEIPTVVAKCLRKPIVIQNISNILWHSMFGLYIIDRWILSSMVPWVERYNVMVCTTYPNPTQIIDYKVKCFGFSRTFVRYSVLIVCQLILRKDFVLNVEWQKTMLIVIAVFRYISTPKYRMTIETK